MRSQSSVLTGKNPAKRVQTDKERGGGKGKDDGKRDRNGEMTQY